ncbi:MAG: YdiU family protein [Magnetococcales bacterium]|nr:YdiU family protein [Magnetococcales bacterium]
MNGSERMMPLTAPVFRFSNSYLSLPDHCFTRVVPVPVAAPRLIVFNRGLAEELGLDPRVLEPLAHLLFSGNLLPEDADPVALVYAGHQFGHFVPRLGDGRAILLGEVIDRRGNRRDIQLKGSGRTPFSRQGDGRAWLGPVLREYLVSEAMHALGIPTTRALAAVATGESVMREEPLPGAVLTRVAASHIRIGTFEYCASRGDFAGVRALAEHVLARHYPDLETGEEPCLDLLRAVADRQAFLVARWMLVGFIHGVMNTDNTTVSGETIDYGPCAFMDAYDPATVFSSIDHLGRYAFANQPDCAAWNLARLAETLLPVMTLDQRVARERAGEVVHGFSGRCAQYHLEGMRVKLGFGASDSGDGVLVRDLLTIMQQGRADYTLTFRHLCAAAGESATDGGVRSLFSDPAPFDAWEVRWKARLQQDGMGTRERLASMRAANPRYIPRNHRVEAALGAALQGDAGPFSTLLELLRHPCDDQPRMGEYAEPPPPSQREFQTFCGT